MQHFNALSAANWLIQQHADKKNFGVLPKDMALSNARQAGAVQDEFVKIKAQKCGDVIGWKIALATPVMQKWWGLMHPYQDGCIANKSSTRQPKYPLKDMAVC